jgi:hypothetical protein
MPRFSRFSRWYGAGPLHLLTMIGCLALAGYAAADLLPSNPVGIAVWLVAAVVGHDLILMPLYTLADRSALAVFRHHPPRQPDVPWINYLRVPVVLSGLLLLIWFPLIFRLPKRFTYTTTLSIDPYLWHWLAITGALFLLSATAYALRLRTARHRHPPRTRGKHEESRGKHSKPPTTEHPPPNNAPHQDDPRQDDPRQTGRSEDGPRQGDPRESGPREGRRSESGPRQGDPRESGPREGRRSESGPRQGDPRESDPREGDPRQSGPPWDLPS